MAGYAGGGRQPKLKDKQRVEAPGRIGRSPQAPRGAPDVPAPASRPVAPVRGLTARQSPLVSQSTPTPLRTSPDVPTAAQRPVMRPQLPYASPMAAVRASALTPVARAPAATLAPRARALPADAPRVRAVDRTPLPKPEKGAIGRASNRDLPSKVSFQYKGLPPNVRPGDVKPKAAAAVAKGPPRKLEPAKKRKSFRESKYLFDWLGQK